MSELLETVFAETKQVVFVNTESQDDKLGIHALYSGFSQKNRLNNSPIFPCFLGHFLKTFRLTENHF